MSECSYCKGRIEGSATRCPSCGAPVTMSEPSADYRLCPYCGRKLLALASPACSYCGRRLPDEYIKARAEDLDRIGQISDLPVTEQENKSDSRASRPGSRLADVVVDWLDIFR